MAVKRSPRGKWMIDVCIALPDGRTKRVRKVSPIQTKRAAQALERETREGLLAELSGKESTPKVEEERAPAPTLAEFVEDFLAYQTTLNKPNEMRAKRISFELHLLPAFGELRLDEIDARRIDRFKIEKSKTVAKRNKEPRKLSPKSINNMVHILLRALRIAHKWGMIDSVPQIDMLRVPKQRFDFLTFEEAELFLAAAREHHPQWFPYALVSLRTGLRVGEMLALNWADHVRLEQRQLRVELSYTRVGGFDTPKSGRAREVPLASDAVEALKEQRAYAGKSKLVFPREGGEVGSLRSVQRFMGKIGKQAELRHIYPHMLRHSFASHAVMRGVPIRVVQEWLGHSSIEMTMRYSHLAEGVSHNMIERLAVHAHGTIAAPLGAPEAKTGPSTH